MSQESMRLTTLVEPIALAHGFDIEELQLRTDGDDAEIVLTVDRDGNASLDALTNLSRAVSATLDTDPTYADGDVVLEVTTPGIDRPLTVPRHWRRAQGRKVSVEFVPGLSAQRITGRIGVLVEGTDAGEGSVEIIENQRGRYVTHRVALAEVANAVVQVDFSTPNATELAKCGLSADDIERRTAAAKANTDLTASDNTALDNTAADSTNE